MVFGRGVFGRGVWEGGWVGRCRCHCGWGVHVGMWMGGWMDWCGFRCELEGTCMCLGGEGLGGWVGG